MTQLVTLLYLLVSLLLIGVAGWAYEAIETDWLRWGAYVYLAMCWVAAVRVLRRLTP